MQRLLVIIIFFCLIIPAVFPKNVNAAKKFVPSSKTTVVRKSGSTSSIPAIVRYRPDRLGILLSFTNFNGLESVSYSFMYTTNGNPQGAGGTITANNNPTMQRELLFGTCSTSVCTYHYNLADARLTLTGKLTNGRKISKTYRIKTYR